MLAPVLYWTGTDKVMPELLVFVKSKVKSKSAAPLAPPKVV
jgi:hypothetical protein